MPNSSLLLRINELGIPHIFARCVSGNFPNSDTLLFVHLILDFAKVFP
jgi:hypothetical protein